jgi:hypothetical protein
MTRNLKLQPMVIPSTHYRVSRVYSKLNLQGKWLSEAGFRPGENVQVSIEFKRLVIELVE